MRFHLAEVIKPLKGVVHHQPFVDRYAELAESGDFPKLKDNVKDFIALKLKNPLLRYGSNDGAMQGLLKGYLHAHVVRSPYAITVIYQIKQHKLHLIDLVYHFEYEGKGKKKLAKKLSKIDVAA